MSNHVVYLIYTNYICELFLNKNGNKKKANVLKKKINDKWIRSGSNQLELPRFAYSRPLLVSCCCCC